MFKFACFFISVVVASSYGVNALTQEERLAFRKDIDPIMMECAKDHGVSADTIKLAREGGPVDGIPDCFLACLFKKAGNVNEQGFFESEKSLEQIHAYMKSEEDLAKFEAVTKKCISVNDQAVSDGAAGCERSKLVLSCFLENKAEIFL